MFDEDVIGIGERDAGTAEPSGGSRGSRGSREVLRVPDDMVVLEVRAVFGMVLRSAIMSFARGSRELVDFASIVNACDEDR